jgi:hypothetical protein
LKKNLTKLTITYLSSSKSFRSFPKTTAECVTLADDTNTETGCKQCTANSLTNGLDSTLFSFDQIIPASVCKLNSNDGLTTVYCSQVEYGNKPSISFSCYQGAFSAETPLQPTVKTDCFFLLL